MMWRIAIIIGWLSLGGGAGARLGQGDNRKAQIDFSPFRMTGQLDAAVSRTMCRDGG
jgi:hypothetical protein